LIGVVVCLKFTHQSEMTGGFFNLSA